MRLGTKLILLLVTTLIVTMLIHGYLSIRQDQENIVREMRVGMIGLSRSVQAALQYIYGDEGGIAATQKFIDGVGRAGNIHGLVVYDIAAKPVAVSVSLTDTKDFPNLDPAPVLNIDPRPALVTGESVEGYIETQLYPLCYRVEPIRSSENKLVGALVLGRRGIGYNQILEVRRDRIILTTAVLVVLLATFILFLVRRNVSLPIEDLIERIRAAGEGQWEKRIEVPAKNEIGSLALEFNQMCAKLQELYTRLVKEQQERLNLERNLRRWDKLSSLAQLAAGLPHEIATPLNIIGGRAEFLLRRSRSPEEISDNLQIIRSQIDRIAGIVRQLLEFSRRREPAFRNVELSSLMQKVIGLLQNKIAEKNVTVALKIDRSLPPVPADPDQLQQVFLNLFLNSLQALRSGGRIDISAKIASSEIEDGNYDGKERKLRLEFEDNGAGIPAEHLSQVFDPFF